MLQSVYLGGVQLYDRAGLEGKVGRLAMECDMTENLINMGLRHFHGINLKAHLGDMLTKWQEMSKLLAVINGRKKKGVK